MFHVDADLSGVSFKEFVDGVGVERLVERLGEVVLGGAVSRTSPRIFTKRPTSTAQASGPGSVT